VKGDSFTPNAIDAAGASLSTSANFRLTSITRACTAGSRVQAAGIERCSRSRRAAISTLPFFDLIQRPDKILAGNPSRKRWKKKNE
jgi:hypothetical protein